MELKCINVGWKIILIINYRNIYRYIFTFQNTQIKIINNFLTLRLLSFLLI